MLNRSARNFTLCTFTCMLALGGCAATTHVQISSQSPVQVAPEPATPRVNTTIANRLARNVIATNVSAIQLGAGDRFGSQMHAHYVASLRLYEQHRMFAEVDGGKSSY